MRHSVLVIGAGPVGLTAAIDLAPRLDLRWKSRVAGVTEDADGVEVLVETPDGEYRLRCDYLVAADGARSPMRKLLGHQTQGQVFRDHFLIADMRMTAPFPAKRWFWFDPPFHPGGSVLLHRQPDDVWRINFQLGWDADPDAERRPERVVPRVRAGPDRDAFEGASRAELAPRKIESLAFMFKTRFLQRVAEYAATAPQRQDEYGEYGHDLRKHFDAGAAAPR